MTESVTSLGVTEAPTAEGARPSIDLPIGALIRISAFWLGLTAIDAVVTAAVQARIKFDNLVTPGTEGTALADRRGPGVRVLGRRPADRRLDQRLHDDPLGPAQAVHRVRCAVRRRLPRRHRDGQLAGGDRRVRHAARPQHEHRPRSVPGLRPGPRAGPAGRAGQRDGRACSRSSATCIGFALAAIATSSGNVGVAIIAIAVVEVSRC